MSYQKGYAIVTSQGMILLSTVRLSEQLAKFAYLERIEWINPVAEAHHIDKLFKKLCPKDYIIKKVKVEVIDDPNM